MQLTPAQQAAAATAAAAPAEVAARADGATGEEKEKVAGSIGQGWKGCGGRLVEPLLASIDLIDAAYLIALGEAGGVVPRSEMDRLQAKHRSVREGRCIGLFGMIDIQKNSAGERIAPYNGSHPAMAELGKFFRENGLFTFIRWGSFMCNPPLCITEEQLRLGFEIIDRGLDITDRAFEG